MAAYETAALPGDWVNDAACRGRPDLMEVADPGDEMRAKWLCRSCPVLAQCGDWVLAQPRRMDPDGVVAAMNHNERASRRRRTNRQRRVALLRAEGGQRECGSCGESKPAAEFYARQSRCKACYNLLRSKRRRAAREAMAS